MLTSQWTACNFLSLLSFKNVIKIKLFFPPCIQGVKPLLIGNKFYLRTLPKEPWAVNHKKMEVSKGQQALISQMEWLWLIRDSIFWAGRGKWKRGETESGLDYGLMSAAPRPYSNLLWLIGCNQEWQLNWCYLGISTEVALRQERGAGRGVIKQRWHAVTVFRCCALTEKQVTVYVYVCVCRLYGGNRDFLQHESRVATTTLSKTWMWNRTGTQKPCSPASSSVFSLSNTHTSVSPRFSFVSRVETSFRASDTKTETITNETFSLLAAS